MGDLNIGRLLEAVAAAVGGREALVVRGGVRRSHADYLDRSRRLAACLVARGLGTPRPDPAPWEAGTDLALLYLTNGPEYLEAMVGCYLARVGPANVNYRYTEAEVAGLVADSSAGAAIVHARFAPTLVAAAEQAGRHLELVLVVDDGSGTALPPGAAWLDDALAAADLGLLADVEPSGDDLYVVYTGGTTGRPKAVLWRQHDFLAGALGITGTESGLAAAAAAADPARLRTLPAPPLMHGAAHWNALSCLAGGGTVVFPADAAHVDPDDILDTLEAERCTSLNIVGDAFGIPLADAQARRPRDLSALRHVVTGGAVLSPSTKARWAELVAGLRIVDIVGSSESGRQGIARGDGPAHFELPPTSVVLADDRSHVLPASSPDVGWLATAGPIPRGYLGDPAKTADTFPVVDGTRYVVAGDRARHRPDGTLELLGRDAATINTGGEKVFAEEVESALKAHPAVLDVVVVGRPDARWGSAVVAVVALREGAEVADDDLREAAGATLARYKLPKAFVRVPAVQRTASGKADYSWARTVAVPTSPA